MAILNKLSVLKIAKVSAFTLAEVLITLGIIGVVAAFTIPTIMQKSWTLEQKSQFKKAYSTMHNAIEKTIADVGYLPRCYYWYPGSSPSTCTEICTQKDQWGYCIAWGCQGGGPVPTEYFGDYSECSLLTSEMKKNLKIIKTCTSNAYDNGCIPAYKGLDTMKQAADSNLTDEQAKDATAGDSDTRQSSIRNAPAYVLADGIIFFGQDGLRTEYMVDINGQRGPNKWGQDLFEFLLEGNYQGQWKFVGYSPMIESGGVSTSTMIQNSFK